MAQISGSAPGAAAIERLCYDIVACTSFEDNHSPNNLAKYCQLSAGGAAQGEPLTPSSSDRRGWLCARFCTFPQCLVLRLRGGRCRLRQLQLVCYAECIPSQITLYGGVAASGAFRANAESHHMEPASFTRIGVLPIPDVQQRTNQGRVLHMVHVDFEAEYLKVELNSCHVGMDNLYNQAGLVLLQCLGQPVDPEAASLWNLGAAREKFALEKYTEYPRLDPQNAAVYGLVNQVASLSHAGTATMAAVTDPELLRLLRGVIDAKALAVREERFVEAGKFKALLNYVHQISAKVGKLDLAKAAAVEDEDYALAENLRVAIHEIKVVMWEQVQAYDVNIVGLAPPGGVPVRSTVSTGAVPAALGDSADRSSRSNSRGAPRHHVDPSDSAPAAARVDVTLGIDQDEQVERVARTGRAAGAEPKAPIEPADSQSLAMQGAANSKTPAEDSRPSGSRPASIANRLRESAKPKAPAADNFSVEPSPRSVPRSVNATPRAGPSTTLLNAATPSTELPVSKAEEPAESNIATRQVPNGEIDYDAIKDPFKSNRHSEDTPLKAPPAAV